MRQPSAELFPTNEPIPASQMIGRTEDVKELASRLQNGVHSWLAGPRRTGKTSVCDAALTRCKARGCYVAKVDLFRVGDSAELAEVLAVEVIKNRSPARRLLRATRRAGRTALSAAQATASVKLGKELGEGAEIALTPGFAAQNPSRALDAALELPEAVARADGKRLVLFFDEFQEVAAERKPYGDPDALTKRMRAIFQRGSNVSYLFAGSIEHVMRDLFGPGRRALSGFGSFYELGPIAPEDWRDGLAERYAADGCTIADPGLNRLIELGAGHPRATMLIAQQAHLLSVQLETTEITADLVEVAFQRALVGDRPTMEQTVEGIRRLHRQALAVSRSLATGEPLPTRMHPGVRDRVLKRLETAGVAEHVARGDWRIIDPLLSRYLTDLAPLTV
jgi:hypothetical protein